MRETENNFYWNNIIYHKKIFITLVKGNLWSGNTGIFLGHWICDNLKGKFATLKEVCHWYIEKVKYLSLQPSFNSSKEQFEAWKNDGEIHATLYKYVVRSLRE